MLLRCEQDAWTRSYGAGLDGQQFQTEVNSQDCDRPKWPSMLREPEYDERDDL